MCNQYRFLKGLRLILLLGIWLGISFFLQPNSSPLLAAETDPTINSIIVNGTTMPGSNLSPISYNYRNTRIHSFAAILSNDRMSGFNYELTISFSPAANTVSMPVNVDSINLGDLLLQEQTTYTVTYTLSKQQGTNSKTTVQTRSFSLSTGIFDNTSPQVESSYPTAGSTTWAINDNLLIYFSEEIDSSTISNGTVILRDSSNRSITCQSFHPQVTGGKTILTIDPIDSLSYSSTYTLNINGLKDLAGNSLAAYSLTFTTIADSNPPRLIASNPADNASNVPLRGPFTLTFNKSLNTNSINNQTIFLTGSNGYRPAISLATSNKNGATMVIITPAADLAYLSTYTINIINSGVNAVKDLSGQTVPASTLSFTTIPAGAPSIISQSPAPYSSNVSVDSVLSFTFSQDMDQSTLNSSNIYLRKDGSLSNIPASITYNAGNRSLNLTPYSRLESGVRYYIYVTAAVKGSNTLAINPVSWYFSTGSHGNNVSIIERDPAANASGVAVDKVICFRFNTSMNSASINASSVYLTLAGSIVPAQVSYDSVYKQVSIRPTSYLNSDCEYQVNVSNSVQDYYGNIAASSWKFYTGYVYSSGISERDPSVNASGVDLDSVISFRFDTDMNPSTINNSNIYLTRGRSSVSCRINYDSYTRRVTITPYNNLLVDTEYTVNVSGDVRDSNGNRFSATSWRFTTSYNSYYNNYNPAAIIDRDPYSGASGVAVDKQIRFRFDKEMRSSTINSSNIYLTRSGSSVSIRVSYDSYSRWVTITPASNLLSNTEYTVNLSSDIRDYDGRYISSTSWRFSTGSSTFSSTASSRTFPNVPWLDPVGIPGQPRLMLDGKFVIFTDVQPYIKNNRTFLPFRTLLELMGAEVSWDQKQQKVTARLNGNTIQLVIGQKKALRNNQIILLDVAPEIKNNRTMIPLRFVTESLGFKTDWQASTNTIILTS